MTGDLGDVIYGLAVIRHLGGGTLYLKSEPTITRPLTQGMFESLKSIIAPQGYIDAVKWHQGEKINHDFTHFRQHYTHLRSLVGTQAHYRDIRGVDTWTPWLAAPAPIAHGRPVVARSARYQNHSWRHIWPEVMARYPNALFIGHPPEHEAFKAAFGNIERAETATFADVANLIAGSSMFIGNQSSPYAIAEGLKANSIQETCPTHLDCIYPRRNAAFITRPEQWAAVRDGRNPSTGLMLALQCHPASAEHARDLVALICDIEPAKRTDAEFLIACRRDTDKDLVKQIAEIAAAKFGKVHVMRGNRMGTGWPAGPNDLWQELTMRVSILKKEGKTQCDAMLTFEPDCIPLRADWIAVLKAAWAQADATDRDCCGHVETDPDHINGNGIFRIGIAKAHPELYGTPAHTGWDTWHARTLLLLGEDTPAITQRYQWQGYGRADIEAVRKQGKIPALLHGTKGGEGIAIARAMHADGTLAARVA